MNMHNCYTCSFICSKYAYSTVTHVMNAHFRMHNAIDMALGMSIAGYRFQQYMFFYHDENSERDP